MKFKKYSIKTLTVIIGSIISAYGITLAIGAGFGGATLAILWQGLTNVTGMTIGTSSLVVAVAMIIFAFFYDRKQINVGTILYQIIYSFFVDIFTKIQHYTEIKAVNFILMLVGIVIFSFGTGLYSAADFGRGSYEAVTFSLAEKNKWKVKTVRMILDVLMVVAGVLLGGKFGICTIATVLLSGPIIQTTVTVANKTKIFKSIQ
ncbi:YitT family protein [uncultured Eubacterium sp.]|uniref:YczE/YyaS/YitT family protein n=1 Tax=uncultured Eubacterium sp. TaxID=165185 RepID=UPI0025CF5FF4|nr:YitT family protein [uncultured Eubacterium sp.]